MGVIRPNGFYTDQGRAEGVALHSWLLHLCQGKPDREAHPSIAGRVEGIRKFLRDSRFGIVGGETPQYDCVTDSAVKPDIWGTINGVRCVIDAKRGARVSWHSLQTAAQWGALVGTAFVARRRGALYLRNGAYSMDWHDSPEEYQLWRAICRAWHLMTPEQMESFRNGILPQHGNPAMLSAWNAVKAYQ
jgi:hypothetical protein